MAKGNLFLGFGSGKVGDVVFYRANGEQLSRARNRSPRNPNSTKQAVQRAVAASVSRLYSLMQPLCNHSFQGHAQGEENQRVFSKLNLPILRNLVIDDLNNSLSGSAAAARVSAPGVSVAVPFAGAAVSSGSYAQTAFVWQQTSHAYQLPDASSGETVAQYAARVGLVAGDIYTIGVVNCNPSSTPLYTAGASADAYGSVYQSKMTWMQWMVKSGLSGDTSSMSGKTLGDLFSYVGGNSAAVNYEYNDALTISLIDADNQEWTEGCIFCIRSRWDADLRSTSYLMPATASQAYGLSTDKLLSAWRDREGLTDVELILEGRDFDGVSEADLPIPVQGKYQVFADAGCMAYPVVGQAYQTLYLRCNDGVDTDTDDNYNQATLGVFDKLHVTADDGRVLVFLYSDFGEEETVVGVPAAPGTVVTCVAATAQTIGEGAVFIFGE